MMMTDAPISLPRGAAMIDVVGTMLTDDDKRRLLNPNVGGVILFRRNFLSIEQLKELVKEIKALRTPELLIAVDHEGGRVQRFINGFTRLPAMANLGKYADKNGIHAAEIMAEKTGFVLAADVRAALTCLLRLFWIWIMRAVRSSATAVFTASPIWLLALPLPCKGV